MGGVRQSTSLTRHAHTVDWAKQTNQQPEGVPTPGGGENHRRQSEVRRATRYARRNHDEARVRDGGPPPSENYSGALQSPETHARVSGGVESVLYCPVHVPM